MRDLITVPPVLEAEPIEVVHVTVKPHPLRQSHELRDMPAGLTVAEIVARAIAPRFTGWVRVWAEREEIPARWWGRYWPKAGRHLTVAALPANGGGGNKGVVEWILGATLIVAGIAASFLFPPAAPYLIGTGLSLGVHGLATMTGLIPQPTLGQLSGTSGDKTSPTYFIAGARNELRPWGVIPRLYGRHRVYPPLVARTYTEVVGDTQYLRCLFGIQGPVTISDIRIGDTPIANFSDVEMEIRNGFPNDPPVTLYPSQVAETGLSLTLDQTFQTRTSADDADELSVDIDFPRGLVSFSDTGSRQNRTVELEIQYRRTTASDWNTVTAEDGGNPKVKEKLSEPLKRGFRWKVQMGRGKYEVRVRRVKAESTSTRVQDMAVWSALRTMTAEQPINLAKQFPTLYSSGVPTRNDRGGLALIALRIRATDQLNSQIETLNFIGQSILMDYGSASLEFDGLKDYLNARRTAQVTGAGARTIECRAKITAAGTLWSAGTAGGSLTDFCLRLTNAGTEEWEVTVGTGSELVVAVAGTVGAWHHYAVSYDGTTLSFYVDGALKGSSTPTLATTAADIEIGARAGANYFEGLMREFRAWTVCRSAAEILAAANTPLYLRSETPALYLRMNEGAGDTVHDYGTEQDGHIDRNGDAEALDCRFWMAGGASGYLYKDLTAVADYTIQAGDYLEYDIYTPAGGAEQKIGVDLSGSWGDLRDEGAVDQNSLDANPGTLGVAAYSSGQWYHRRIALPVGLVGEDVTKFCIGCEWNTAGEYRAWLRGVNITDGAGAVRKAIWNSGDGSPATSTSETSDGDQSASLDEVENPEGAVGPEWATGEASAWEPRPTSSPVAAFRDLLQGQGNKRAVADGRLDLTGLAAWRGRAAASGYEFNHVLDYEATLADALAFCCGAARSSPTIRDGLFSVIEDVAQSVPIQHFTPHNSSGFRGVKAFRELPHALRVRYVDAAEDWQQREVEVYDDGYTASTASRWEQLEVKGITSRTAAYKAGRYTLAGLRLRPESFELTVDAENLVCTRGDLVRVAHDVIGVGLMTGRVKSTTLDGADVTALVLTEQVTMEAGKSYSLAIRLADGSTVTVGLVTVAGTSAAVTLAAPSDAGIEAGDLFMFGVTGSESIDCLVAGIEPGEELSARLTLIPAAPNIHTADTGPIPPYLSGYGAGPIQNVEPPIVWQVTTDEQAAVVLADGQIQPRIRLSVRFASSNRERPAYLQALIRASGDSEYRAVPLIPVGRDVLLDGVETGRSYDIRLRGLTARSEPSDWVDMPGVYCIGLSSAPPPVDWFTASETVDGRRIFQWGHNATAIDVVGAQIRWRAGYDAGWGWDDLDPLHEGTLRLAPWETSRPIGTGTFTFAICRVDVLGLLSDPVIITRDFTALPAGVLHVEDARAQGWPGTLTGCWINGTVNHQGVGELEATNQTQWADLTTWAAYTPWNDSPNDLVYEHPAIDLGASLTVTPGADVNYDGTLTLEARTSADGVTWGAYGALGSVTNQFIQLRATVAPSGAGSVPILRELLIHIKE